MAASSTPRATLTRTSSRARWARRRPFRSKAAGCCSAPGRPSGSASSMDRARGACWSRCLTDSRKSKVESRKWLLLALLCGACGHQKAAPRPMQLEGVIITPQEVLDDATLFQRAGDDLAQKRYAEAARKYDTLLQSFPGSRLVLPALYNAGLAYEGKDEYATAAERYRALSERFPDTKDAVDARYKLGACYAELKNWPASKEAYARLYERTDLSLSDRLEALARRGYAEFNLRDVGTAERTFRQVLALFHEHETEERLDTDFFVAMAQYHLGAVAQARYDAIALHLPEQKMAAEMELKAGLLLDAQAKYIKTVRVGNAHW